MYKIFLGIKIPNLDDVGVAGDFAMIGEGFEGIILSIFIWILVTILIGLFLWVFGAVIWSGVIVFIAMLYWIFFRALRLKTCFQEFKQMS